MDMFACTQDSSEEAQERQTRTEIQTQLSWAGTENPLEAS